MGTMDLRPLSLGEILDRTFTLYRTNFLLFVGISAIPYLLVLALNLAQVFLMVVPAPTPQPGTVEQFAISTAATGGVILLASLVAIAVVIASVIAVLLCQGATVFAVSDLYLGRPTTIGASFRRMRGEVGTLFGVIFLNGLVCFFGFLLLIIPGIYLLCRLAVAVPASLLESLGPRASLERSYALTKENVGRILLIFLLSFVLAIAASSLFELPFNVLIVAARKDPVMLRMWTAFMQIGAFFAQVLVAPIATIATSLLYYDLRVRKEAFDLQMLMQPLGGPTRYNPNAPHPLV